MEVLEIDEQNFKEEVLESEKPVLIDFFATWCGPCKMMSPIIDEIAKEVGNDVKVGKVDVDENQELAIRYDVMSIPTIIIFKNGKVEKTFVGLRDKEEILKELK